MNKNDNSSVAVFSAMLVARHAKPHFTLYISVSLSQVAAGRSCPGRLRGTAVQRTRSPLGHLLQRGARAAGRPRPQRRSYSDFSGRRAGRTGPIPAPVGPCSHRPAPRSGPARRGRPAAPAAAARRRGNEPEPEPGPSPIAGRDGEAGARALGPSLVRDPAPGSRLDTAAAPAALT